MERLIAEIVVRAFKVKGGPQISVLEAMSMKQVKSDRYEVYAVHKGDSTFLAWIAGRDEKGKVDELRIERVSW